MNDELLEKIKKLEQDIRNMQFLLLRICSCLNISSSLLRKE